MRVVQLAPEGLPIPPVRGGSVQIYLYELWQALQAQCGRGETVEITLLAPRPPTGSGGSGGSGGPGGPSGSGEDARPGPALRLLPAASARYQAAALRDLRALDPDIVQIDNRPAWVQAVAAACPRARIVLNLHSLTFLGPMHMKRSEIDVMLRRVDAVTVNSAFVRRQLRRRYGSGAQGRIHVIYPGVRADLFRPAPDAQGGGEDESVHMPRTDTLQLLYVGRMIEQKGPHVLLAALRQLRQQHIRATLLMIGRTPSWERRYGARLQTLSKGLPVVHLPFVDPQDMPAYYQAADLFVCPSQRDEAFGLVNVEALASGVPVAASRVGGIPEIVDSTCGVLVAKPHMPQSFTKAIAHLHRQPELLGTLRCGARQRASRFTWEATATRFLSLYRELYEDAAKDAQ